MPGGNVQAAIDSAGTLGHRLSMSSITSAGAGTLLRQGSFIFFLLSRSLSRLASLVGIVAMGWQVYDLTNSAFSLGLVGLIQFLPQLLLTLFVGHVADRYDRRYISLICQWVKMVMAAILAIGDVPGSWLDRRHGEQRRQYREDHLRV